MIIVEENNIGQYTAAAIDDPRAANKTLYLAPPANSWWSQNELIDLYEKLSGKTVKRNPVSKEAQRRKIDEESEYLFRPLCSSHSMRACIQSQAECYASWQDLHVS